MSVKLYTFTLFCCCSAISLIEFLAPNSFKKQLSYITGMVMLIALLDPIIDIIDSKPFESERLDISDLKSADTDELLASGFEQRLREIISGKLKTDGIFAEDIRIQIIMSEDEVKVGRVDIILKPNDLAKAESVKKKLQQYTGLEIYIQAKGGSK